MENEKENIDNNKNININQEETIQNLKTVNKINDFSQIVQLEPSSKFDLTFKIVIIGNCSVGKTCITNRAIKAQFDDSYKSTIGLEYYTMFIKLNNKIIKLQIWDTCGQEVYRSLISNYYRNSSLAIIVYAINSRESFEDIDFWIKELKEMSSPDIKLILLGNKSDLINERKVEYKEGDEISKNYGFDYFLETSAKTGENISNIFIKAARLLYEDFLKYKDINSENFSDFSGGLSKNTSLKNNLKKKRENNKCCHY